MARIRVGWNSAGNRAPVECPGDERAGRVGEGREEGGLTTMFTRMTIGRRLVTGVAALLVCLLGLGYFSLSAVSGLHNDLEEIANKTAHKIYLTGAINELTTAMRSEARATVLAAVLKRQGDLDAARKNSSQDAALLELKLKELRPLLDTERGKKMADEMETGLSVWKGLFEEMDRLCVAGQIEAADEVRVTKHRPIANMMTKNATEMLGISRELLTVAKKSAAADAARNRRGGHRVPGHLSADWSGDAVLWCAG